MKRVKVLHFICPTGLHGAEMWILALAKHLNRSQIDCSLAVTYESPSQNIEIHQLFRSVDLNSHIIKMRGRFDPSGIYKLISLIKHKKIDIIHTHGYKSDILGLIAARISGIKCIATPHGFENTKNLKLQSFIRLGCMAFKYFDSIAPLSEELQNDLKDYGVPLAKIRLIQNGVDLDELKLINGEKASAKPHSREKKIGYVGQLIPRKNILDLIKAFDFLFMEKPDSRLFIIGDGPEKKRLQGFASSLPSQSRIAFLGYRKDRLALVKQLDLFSMTSTLEGIPRAMMEAIALGVPVSAYDIPGVDKLIIPGKTGLLAKKGDVHALKNCWLKLLFDKKLARDMTHNGKEHIRAYFSAKRMAAEYTDLYFEIISDKECS